MAKGKGFEWEIAKLISQCWDDTGRDDIFIPSDASGARATRRRMKGKDTAFRHGDITFSDPCGKPLIDRWNFELKTGYTKRKKKSTIRTSLDGTQQDQISRIIETPWDVLDLIDSNQKQTQLEEFWEQACTDAKVSNREPVLIFRRNKKQSCIAFRKGYLQLIQSVKGEFNHNHKEVNVILGDGVNLVILNLYGFLDWAGDLSQLIKLL